MTSQETLPPQDLVVVKVLGAMVALAVATAGVQIGLLVERGLAAEGPWILLDVAVGVIFAVLRRVAIAGRAQVAAAGLVGVLGANTLVLLVTGGSDHPLWAVLSAFTVALAMLLMGARGALVTLGVGAAVVLPLVALEDSGAFRPPQAEEAGELNASAIAVEILLLLAFLGWAFRLYLRELAAPAGAAVPTIAAPARTVGLTPREIEVVRLVAEGHSNDAIATRLVVSPRTVHSHVTNAMRKCGCANRTELGVLAVREGLVPLAVSPPEREPATARTP